MCAGALRSSGVPPTQAAVAEVHAADVQRRAVRGAAAADGPVGHEALEWLPQ